MSDELKACLNTDREIWCETPGDYYAPSIHVTESGGIGINVGGHTFVMPVRKWHELAKATFPRSSQNQTVSSGVEGAHEGTTADKCGYCGKPADDLLHTCRASHDYVDHDCHPFRPREPEKLNNAQESGVADE